MLRALAIAALLTAGSPAAQDTPRAFDGRYRFSMAGQPLNGTVWVYYFGYGYIDHFEAGRITRGVATVHAGHELLEHGVDSLGSNGPSFIIAVEVPGTGWYRSAEFGDLTGGFAKALESMNEGPRVAGRINLAAPVRQTIHARNADGSPRRGEILNLSTYVWNDNHCARHEGFDDDVRRVRTGANGDATFVAPLADLFLTNSFYAEHQVRGMRSLSREEGARLPAGREHVVQGAWQRAAPREFRIRVAFADGTPAATAVLIESEDRHTCDFSNNVFEADANGVIVATFAIEHAGDLCFESDGDEENCLTASQRDELNRTGRLSVVWPVSAKTPPPSYSPR
jgi:hypothetical protein